MSISENEKRERALKIFHILKEEYPEARPLLTFSNPFELLIATILAAQCTDERVNMVTPLLFRQFPDAGKLAGAALEHLENIIQSTGFYKQKAKRIKDMAQALVERFGGKVPESIDDLASLPGVGRKTANVVAGNCFGIPAIMVDTHFQRVSGRLGFAFSSNPLKIEPEIRAFVPEEIQTRFSLVINFHGRYCCKARKPLCPSCKVEKLCPFKEKTVK
ncbi:MAG: endonuclease III [Spirochaetales bacterium]|nr:endonuclease III [Spirochaetales bacterium]